MEDILYERVIDFLEHELRPLAVIEPHFEIARDFGPDGDDAWDLMVNFANEFSVDLSTFKFDDFFGWEGLDILAMFKAKKVMTVADLYFAAKAKAWPLETGRTDCDEHSDA